MPIQHELNDAARTFLQEPRFAVLATVSPKGKPQQAVIWYLIEGDELMFNSKEGRLKDRNLAEEPYVSLCVEDGYRYVTIRGRVQVIRDQPTAQEDIRRLAERYHGPERATQMSRDGFSKEERISYRLKLANISCYGFDK